MLFADRLFLAQYSLHALTASANGSMAVYSFLIGPFTIAGISEVFVGQYHGNNDFKQVGPSTWQMIWFSLFLTPAYLLLAYVGPFILFRGTGNEILETQYFAPLTAFGSIFCLVPALIGYFSGLGRVKIVFIANFSANIINVILDYFLIFGWGSIPEMGVLGAAIGTIISQVYQAGILLFFFFRKEDRDIFKTTHWRFRWPLFLRSIQIGLPAGLAHTSEMLAHFAFFRVMIRAGPHYIAIISVVQSFYFLMGFAIEGLSKAVTAIISNLIGAFHYEKIRKVLVSALQLQVIFAAFVFVGILLFAERLFPYFFNAENQTYLSDPAFFRSLKMCSIWLAIFFWLDGWVWAFIGLLTAAGDTKFVMIIGFIAQWLFYFTPVYIGVHIFHVSVEQAWMLICLNSLLLLLIYGWRYYGEKWQAITIRQST